MGGAAAIYGFVHQILASIGQLVRAQFGTVVGKTDPDTIIAVLEPSPGGDLSIETAARKVIQFKHRKVSVSVTAIGDKVLPDLFRAHCDREAAEYELHTTNGVSKPGQQLITSLKSYATAHKKFAADAHVKSALGKLRNIFAAAGRTAEDFEASFATFIARLSIAPSIDADQARAEAIRFLSQRVPHAEKVEDALDTLVGHLAYKARNNDAVISIDELLSRLGLPGAQAGHPDAASERLARSLDEALKARGFDAAFDVRAPILVAPSDSLTLVAGKSGCGKSWGLYRLAADFAKAKRAAVLVRAADREELERQLRLTIGVNALAQEQPLEATVLGQTWRRMQESPEAAITVLWEGCRDAAILENLRLAGGLGPGLNLVAEFPVSQESRLEEFAQTPIHRVGEFTQSQLFEALNKRGVSAGQVPREIRRMLRLPVLCGIYATLALELEHWDPQSEYRVLEDFWERAKRQAGKLAGTRLKALAKSLVAKRRTSLTDDEVVDLGFSETELDALISAGWLNNVVGRWSFAHDRLLTWAIAMAMASEFENGVVDASALAGEVIALQMRDDQDKSRLSGLGFLLMDVVWLIAAFADRIPDAVDFVEQFEPDRWTGGDMLYGDLLPTAGARVLAVLEERARRVTTKNDSISGYLSEAFRMLPIGTSERGALLERLWSTDDKPGRSIAIVLGAAWPLKAQRDALWQSYCDLNRDREARRFDYRLFEHMERALKLLARSDPRWLGRLIDAESGQEELRLAADLLKSLETPAGAPIWAAAREKLLEVIPDDRQTVVMECITRFGNGDDREVLERKIMAGDRSASFALEALAEIDAVAALRVIEQRPPMPSLPHHRYWLDLLLDLDFRRAAPALRHWLIDADPSGRELAALWRAAEERIDADTIALLLDRLQAVIDAPPPGHGRDLCRDLLPLLGSPTLDPVHDPLFYARRNTPLSAAVAKRAIAHFDGEHDEDYVAERRLLRRIGGAEYEGFVLHALSPDDLSTAHTGITLSIFCPTKVVVARLAELLEIGISADKENTPLLDLWRMLLAIDRATWRPRLLALLGSEDENSVLIGLHLLPEFAEKGDQAPVLACFEASTRGSAIEARAMAVAIKLGDPGEPMVRRALEHIQGAEGGEATAGCLNVLLNDRSEAGRAALDAYLAPLETAKSWKSYDSQALAIRLGQGDAAPGLWRAGGRMMHSAFSRERFIEAILEHDPARAMDVLLDRAFAAPDMFVDAQPHAIEVLATANKPLATQAFIQSWKEHPKRREHLASSARLLDEGALEAMIASLAEEYRAGPPSKTYRSICVEVRRARERAWPLLLAKFAEASPDDRIALCPALGWAADASDKLLLPLGAESDNEVRRELYKTWRYWWQVEAAVSQFRTLRTLESMEYAIDFSDPTPLSAWGDSLRIIEPIGEDSRLVGFAERQFAVRLNKVSGSKFKRVVIRKSLDEN